MILQNNFAPGKNHPLKVGITGGIGSGKSFVCDLFKQHFGIAVYNTDLEVKKDILKRKSVRQKMVSRFGIDSYYPDGNWNRDKFIKLLFDDENERSFVNQVISYELGSAIEHWSKNQSGKYVLIECAVLFENGLNKFVDLTLAVSCSDYLKKERLEKRGVNEELFNKVKKIQFDGNTIASMANYIIYNEYDLEKLKQDVQFFHSIFEGYN